MVAVAVADADLSPDAVADSPLEPVELLSPEAVADLPLEPDEL